MSAILDAKALIKTVPQIDEVYTYSIPKNIVHDTTKTIALLREVQIQADEEGNNSFNAIDTQLQLQIFLKLDVDFDTEEFQVNLLRLFEKNEYECYTFGGWMADPDTEQLSNSIYIQKLSYLNREE